MKPKHIILTTLLSLFVAGSVFSQGAKERVYVRIYNMLGGGEAYVWEKGETTKISLTGIASKAGKEGNLKEVATLLEDYYKKGFKILFVTNLSTGVNVETIYEYIFEKQ